MKQYIKMIRIICFMLILCCSAGGGTAAEVDPLNPLNPLNPSTPLDPRDPRDSVYATPEVIVQNGGSPTSAVTPGTGERINTGVIAPPAWAANAMQRPMVAELLPFGNNLFSGNFSNTRPNELGPDYVIIPGDQVTIRLWGMQNFDSTQVVDHQGNIFIPEIGPVTVGWIRHDSLSRMVAQKVKSVYPTGVEIYTNLLSAQPLSVYVSGFVSKPGRYAGGASDNVLAFIDRAGGIIGQRGSYRSVKIMRGQSEIASADLYEFILDGVLPTVRLQENDVILIQERGPSVAVLGDVRQQARYEYPPDPGRPSDASSFSGFFLGSDLIAMASPLESVTNVSVSGVRRGVPFNSYLSRQEFREFLLTDNDVVEFISGQRGDGMMVMVMGEVTGDARYPVKKGTYLRDLLAYIPVNTSTADVDALYLRRRSVAEQQKKSLDDSLRRLEQTALTASSSSPQEAEIRVKESQMIQNFVQRARLVEPDGVVVVRRGGQTANIMLEDGDVVVVPPKRHVVQISGEVLTPKMVAYQPGITLERYIAECGGFTRRADRRNVLVARPNGEVFNEKNMIIRPGDHIMVLPRYESKNLLLVKDISQILYQMAVATKVALDL